MVWLGAVAVRVVMALASRAERDRRSIEWTLNSVFRVFVILSQHHNHLEYAKMKTAGKRPTKEPTISV